MVYLMDLLGHDAPDIKTVDVGTRPVGKNLGNVHTFVKRGKGCIVGFERVRRSPRADKTISTETYCAFVAATPLNANKSRRLPPRLA